MGKNLIVQIYFHTFYPISNTNTFLIALINNIFNNFFALWKDSIPYELGTLGDFPPQFWLKFTPYIVGVDEYEFYSRNIRNFALPGYEAWKAWRTFNQDIFLIIVTWLKRGKSFYDYQKYIMLNEGHLNLKNEITKKI